MIKIGKRQKLKIYSFRSCGAYLDIGDGEAENCILLPNSEVDGKNFSVGDEVDVLVYRDSEDRLTATLKKTKLLVGELGVLEVSDINKIGAFLEWGLPKELLLPHSQIVGKVEKGDSVLVGVYEDSKGRISATMKIYNFLMPTTNYNKNDIVTGTVYNVNSEYGVFVAVENRYFGLIPKSECFRKFKVGEVIDARVIRVREDGKLDLAIRDQLIQQIDKDAELILSKMKILKTYFRFNDDSSPEDIKEYFGISKKAFKRAIGKLLKEEKIKKNENGNFSLL